MQRPARRAETSSSTSGGSWKKSGKGERSRDFSANLRRGGPATIYFLYGEEDLLVEEAVQAIIQLALKETERSFNLDILNGGEIETRGVLTLASTFPMLSERRVVVVREVEKMPGADLLATYVENPSPTTTLILVGGKPDLRRSPFHQLRKLETSYEFSRLYDRQIPSWIEERVLRAGCRISPEGSRLLSEYGGTNLREIQNEIEKLLVYIGGRKVITLEDVEAVAGMSREFNVFELQKALGKKESPKVMEISHKMIQAGEPVLRIVFALGNYFITLSKLMELRRKGVPQDQQASQIGVRPYFLHEYIEAAVNYSEDELENALLCIAFADAELKRSILKPGQILHFMLAAILTGPGNSGGL